MQAMINNALPRVAQALPRVTIFFFFLNYYIHFNKKLDGNALLYQQKYHNE
jgi:hypothetical protein